MGKLESKSKINYFVLLCVIVYFFSYITRINYAAIIVELIRSIGISKTTASIVTTVSFITYGVGQLISGFLGDRISPRLLVFAGFIATFLMNILMPVFSYNISLMAIIWGINGVAQAFMWPPLVKIMTSALSDEVYSKSVPFIGMGSASATIIIYLVSPVIISLLGWKYVFYICGFFGLFAAILWLVSTKYLLKDVEIPLISGSKSTKQDIKIKSENISDNVTVVLKKFIPIIILTIAIQGLLRDGITTWVPSYISESFKIKSTTSILSGVALPIFHLINNLIAYRVLRLFKNDVFKTIEAYFFGAGLLLILLHFFGVHSMWISLLFLSGTSGFLCSVNLLQTAYIPKYFKEAGSVSTVCGLFNFATYIGSALSTYLFALISDNNGWSATVLSWIAFSIVGTVITKIIQVKISKLNINI